MDEPNKRQKTNVEFLFGLHHFLSENCAAVVIISSLGMGILNALLCDIFHYAGRFRCLNILRRSRRDENMLLQEFALSLNVFQKIAKRSTELIPFKKKKREETVA